MPIALRRSKSLPIWLAVLAAVTVLVTVVAVIATSLLSAHRATDNPAGETARARMQQAMLAQTPSADTLKGQSGEGGGVGDTQASAGAAGNRVGVDTSDATDATAAMASASSDSSDGPSAAPSVQVPTLAAPSASQHRSRANASRAAARHKADSARDGASLRADIARYNAERGANLTTQQLVPLRTAVVPAGHSLWDDVPAPMSDVYRN